MTIEEILNCSADQLEKMTDAELLQHFAPYLNVTRPDLAAKPERKSSAGNKDRSSAPSLDDKMAKAMAIMKNMGMDFGDM